MTVRGLRLLAAVLSGLYVAFTASRASAQPYVNFRCADGSPLTLIFEKGGTGLVMIGGGALRLNDRRPASGLWFASPHGELRADGANATFRRTGRPPTSCRKVGARGKSRWR